MPNHNTHYIVKNVNGTAGRKCNCGSWIKHWRDYSGSKRSKCSVLGCSNEAEVGAHVIHTDKRTSNKQWIVPLCRPCNHKYNDKNMPIDSRVDLISANVSITCGK